MEEMIHKPMVPPISYYGGKQRMASKFIKLLPKHTVYVEPFCGGATILFKKPWPDVTNTHHYREVINDIDRNLVNFYRVLRDPELGHELVRRLELTPYARAEHIRAKEIIKDAKAYRLDKAWAYYVIIQMSFSHISHGGWGTGVFSMNTGAMFSNKVSNLHEYVTRMQGVHIECLDAIDVIKKWDSPQTLFYCDPPYPGSNQGDYSGYTHDDLRRLISALDDAKGSFLLSNYAQDYMPEHWDHFEFHTATSSANGRGKVRGARVEHVWRMDRSANVRPEIKRLFDSGKFDCFKGRK